MDVKRKPAKKNDGFVAYSPDLAENNGGFNQKSFSVLYDHEAGNFWFKARNKLILSLIKKYHISGQSYLEIGCGTGYVLQAIENEYPDMKCWGSEIYTEGLKYTKKRVKRSELIQMDATYIPFRKKFELIGAYDVLEHIDEDTKVLSEIYKALTDKGSLVLTVPQHRFLWSSADDYACHKRRYSKSELKEKIKNAGFDIIITGSYTSLLFPFMIISRLRMKNKKYNPDLEFRIPEWLNKLFEFILTIEINLTLFGVRFPFGGSLVAIAQKNKI